MARTINRKDFLKKLGLAGAAIAIAPISSTAKAFTADETNIVLNTEQKDFLRNYESWLTEFNAFIEVQKEDFSNTRNNHKLMELSNQANVWKDQLTNHMTDGNFAAAYLELTEKVRSSINL